MTASSDWAPIPDHAIHLDAFPHQAVTDLPDSGLRWCVEHASLLSFAPLKIGRMVAAGDAMCEKSISQAWRAYEPAMRDDDWPTECRHVPLLVGDAPVAVEGQGVLL